MDIKLITICLYNIQMLTVQARSCDFPNNTATSIHWWPCGSGTIEFSNFTLENLNGTEEYPLDLSKSLVLAAELINYGKTHWKIKNSVELWLFGGWFQCGWITIPTFGLLSDRDACASGVPCPIKPGRQQLRIPLDFANYTLITKLLKNDAPYQIRYVIVNEETGESNCFFMQIRVKSI